MANESQGDAVNRLMSAFRKELDVYAQELLATEPERPKPRKRVEWDEAPAYFAPGTPLDRQREEHEPPPVQTPSVNPISSPPLSAGRSSTNSADTPTFSKSKNSLSTKDWKLQVNAIVDTLEEHESRAIMLRQENDILIRDYASLQDEMARLQTAKIKPLMDQNDDLRDEVEGLRAKLSNSQSQFQNTKDSMEREIDDLRSQLREIRNEYAAVEQQNDRLHDRLRGYQKESQSQPGSPGGLRYSGETNGGPSRHYSSYRERETRYQSPGDALVRDLSEKTSLDADDLAPLSKILDRRLGRETPSRSAGRNGNRY
mmetsp:Transcript_22747/g.49676  ORF Transcript_22747/g.49676 Transcript_22747/m.49676 type:complete len:314 (+) Transcript_22747:169-1110(+)